MLVLSRKKNEKVVIRTADGTVITLVVVEIKGDKARIGFEAPAEVAIHREETYRDMAKNPDTTFLTAAQAQRIAGPS